MSFLDECLTANRGWAREMVERDPLYFERLKHGQRPELLWIGCADSRIAPTHLIGRRPGEVFVHRNVANLVRPDDPSCLAVVEYAIERLGIRQVVVCGHSCCGGVEAALAGLSGGHVGGWLKPLRAVARAHEAELQGLDPEARSDRLCELNVAEQVANLTRTEVIRRAWQRGIRVSLHGWIYSVGDGLLRALDLWSVESLGRATPAHPMAAVAPGAGAPGTPRGPAPRPARGA